MNKPTTIRLDDEYRKKLRVLAVIRGTQTQAIKEAIDLMLSLHSADLEQAEKFIRERD